MAERCVLCGSTDLVNSHLMPAAFGRDIKAAGKAVWIGSATRSGKRISQSGAFDRFLCPDHEAAMHDAEEYAIAFIREFDLSPSEIEERRFRRDGTDNEALVRFVCSVLWRFHHSTKTEAEHIDVGEWEPNLRAVTFDGAPASEAPDVLMLASHYAAPKDVFLSTPARGTHFGLETLQFTVRGLTFTTKLAHEPWPPVVQRAVLNATPDWIESGVRVWGEREWRDMKTSVNRLLSPQGAHRRPANTARSALRDDGDID